MIHGPQNVLRRCVVQKLLERGFVRRAFRYACCGLGDKLHEADGRVTLSPRGCGHKLCPRCGRKSGQRIAGRCLRWLATEPHGDVLTMCLTQPQIEGERLPAARARMQGKERRYMKRLRELGLMSAVLATHVIVAKGMDAWHYHVHLLLEFPGGRVTPEQLRAEWEACFRGDEHTMTTEQQARLVVKAGPAIPALLADDGQLDFWSESTDHLARAIQYPFRDLAQGVSALRLGNDEDRVYHAVAEILAKGNNWKLRRSMGRWRRRPDPEAVQAVVEKLEADGKATKAAPKKERTVTLGTVHVLYRRAQRGDFECVRIFARFALSARNETDFARRLVAFCQRVQPGGP